MADVFSRLKRSEVMSRIRSRGNKDTELTLVRVFRAHGIQGWRRHQKLRVERPASRVKGAKRSGSRHLSLVPPLSVRPDFVFRAARVAVFVDGCFWHACPLHATQPKGNASFWRKKLAANVARDRKVNRALRRAGWRVLRIWEHTLRWAIRDANSEAALVRRIQRALGA